MCVWFTRLTPLMVMSPLAAVALISGAVRLILVGLPISTSPASVTFTVAPFMVISASPPSTSIFAPYFAAPGYLPPAVTLKAPAASMLTKVPASMLTVVPATMPTPVLAFRLMLAALLLA